MFWEGTVVQALCDYILSGRQVRWWNFKVVDTLIDTDHRLVKGTLRVGDSHKKYRNYMKQRKSPPINLFGESGGNSDTEVNSILRELKEAIPKQDPDKSKNRTWISEESFDLLSKKCKAVNGNRIEEAQGLRKQLRRSIRQDRRRRVENVANQIEALLEGGDIIGAFENLRSWYRKFTGRPLKPSEVRLNERKVVYDKLFTCDNLTIPFTYDFPYEGEEVDDGEPTEDEILRALAKMRNRKAPGMTGIAIDHIKLWYELAYPKTEDEVRIEGDAEALKRWNQVVLLIKQCLVHGNIPDAFLYGVLVIIPKDDKGGVRGIGLLEAIHKLISQIINLRIAAAVKFDEDVHGFRRRRGTYTAIGERKLRMQMAACLSTTVYQVYLDLRKAYDSVDRERVITLLEKYKVGPNIRRYIQKVWEGQRYYLRQGGFYSDAVEVNRGCTQGDTDSPIIFNLIVDAVLRTWKNSCGEGHSQSCFYADDGLLEHTNSTILQSDLDIIIQLFSQIGLKANVDKTKFMVVRGAAAPRALTTEQYEQRMNKRRTRQTIFGNGSEEWRKQRVECTQCGKVMQMASLNRHIKTQHNRHNDNQYQCTPVDDSNIKGKIFNLNWNTNTRNHCPIPGCSGGGNDKSTMYRHFNLMHPLADIIIDVDGLLPKCDKCGFRSKNMEKHRDSSTCKQAQRRKANSMKQEEQERASKVKFYVNGLPIQRVRQFRYLGRIFTESDNDSVCIQENLSNARRRWNCVAKILKTEGANAKCMAKFYITIVQAVLLYGADSWVVTKRDMNKLRSFHHRAIRYITGRHIRKHDEDRWEYPDHQQLLKECQLFPIEVYVERRRGTLRSYFEEYTPALLESAKLVKRHCKDVHKILWWDQNWKFKKDFTNFPIFGLTIK